MALLTALLAAAGCGLPAVGRGGAVYEVTVNSVNGQPTAAQGPAGFPACTIQVGDRAARVWLAANPPRTDKAPVLLVADVAALRAGILIETSWSAAVVHEVGDEELASEGTLVRVPHGTGYHVVELHFRLLSRPPLAAK